MSGKKEKSDKSETLWAVLSIAFWIYFAFALTTRESNKPKIRNVIQGTQGTTDNRISPHGRVRPTLAASTIVAPVHYRNSNTGKESDYECDIDLDSEGRVQRINWPTGGWLEARGLVDNGDGTQTITTDRGYEYTVDLNGQDDPEDDSSDYS